MDSSPDGGPAAAPTGVRTAKIDECPVCRHDRTTGSFDAVDLLHALPGTFTYAQCASCGSFFQNPRVVRDDLPLCYPADYFTHDRPGPPLEESTSQLRTAARRCVLRSRRPSPHRSRVTGRLIGWLLHAVPYVRRRVMFGLVDELEPPTASDRCLELGPGTGDDMWRLARLGWRVHGLDLDAPAAALAATRSGCPVSVGDVLDHAPSEHYGLIYGSHSIEHVPELGATIAHLRTLLVPQGRLVLIIPNPRSLTSRRFGPLSVVWDPPRHLSLPTAAAWRQLLRRNGFRAVSVRTTARRAAQYHAIARARHAGATGREAWEAPWSRQERPFQAVEAVLAWSGWAVGEEIVVSAAAT